MFLSLFVYYLLLGPLLSLISLQTIEDPLFVQMEHFQRRRLLIELN